MLEVLEHAYEVAYKTCNNYYASFTSNQEDLDRLDKHILRTIIDGTEFYHESTVHNFSWDDVRCANQLARLVEAWIDETCDYKDSIGRLRQILEYNKHGYIYEYKHTKRDD